MWRGGVHEIAVDLPRYEFVSFYFIPIYMYQYIKIRRKGGNRVAGHEIDLNIAAMRISVFSLYQYDHTSL